MKRNEIVKDAEDKMARFFSITSDNFDHFCRKTTTFAEAVFKMPNIWYSLFRRGID